MTTKLSEDYMNSEFRIPTIDIDDSGISIFGETTHELVDRNGMLLSEQINAVNFRLRESLAGYETDWHVAGDPTLLLIMSGTLRISLRDGDFRDFSKGELFIAKDRLLADSEFDKLRHGHRAQVIGDGLLRVVHIKLAKLVD